jgi:E3 ubiquitin-protein ligase RHF
LVGFVNRGRGIDEKAANMEKLSSAAAFVEGGVQDACDDACSICLEAFCDSDPSTVATSLLRPSR